MICPITHDEIVERTNPLTGRVSLVIYTNPHARRYQQRAFRSFKPKPVREDKQADRPLQGLRSRKRPPTGAKRINPDGYYSVSSV